MTISTDIDHIFICVSPQAAEMQALLELGFIEADGNIHPGQGTANRRLFVKNAMLELLWVHSNDEALSPLTKPTHLYDRWKDKTNSCPFGICITKDIQELGLPIWPYKPAYLPPTKDIQMANFSNPLSAPMLFNTGFGGRPDQRKNPPPLNHSNGIGELSKVILYLPEISEETNKLKNINGLELKQGKYHMELEFDHCQQKQQAEITQLSVTLHW